MLWSDWRGEEAWMKQISELSGAWRRRGSDGLTCGGSASVLLPLGELGLNPKPSEPASSDC